MRHNDGIDVRKSFSKVVTGLSTFDAIRKKLQPPIEYIVCQKTAIDGMTSVKCKEVLDFASSIGLLQDIIQNNQRKRWLCFFSSLSELDEFASVAPTLFPDHTIYIISSKSKTRLKDITDEKAVILSVDMLLEGVHPKRAGGIILFRNVESPSTFQQIIGRVTAINSGESPIVIDCSKSSFKLLRMLIMGEPSKAKLKNTADTTCVINAINSKQPDRSVIKVSKFFTDNKLICCSDSSFHNTACGAEDCSCSGVWSDRAVCL